jgi:hypothetical protein
MHAETSFDAGLVKFVTMKLIVDFYEQIRMPENDDGNSCKSKVTSCKSLIYSCAASAFTALACSFIVLKIGISDGNKKIEMAASDILSLSSKVNVIEGTISSLKKDISTLKSDLKSNQDRMINLYSQVASLQKDIVAVRDTLNLRIADVDDSVKDLPPENRDFIESLEGLIKNGSPFDGLIASFAGKIDLEDYVCGRRLVEYSKVQTKSIDTIKKDFATIGRLVFNIELAESFWARQKRRIIEKLSSIVKIRSDDGDAAPKSADDKSLFEMAYNALSKGDIRRCLKYLEKIKGRDERVGNLTSDVRSRVDLDSAFAEFKKEFTAAKKETSNPPNQ